MPGKSARTNTMIAAKQVFTACFVSDYINKMAGFAFTPHVLHSVKRN
jgi:hypothetical protein